MLHDLPDHLKDRSVDAQIIKTENHLPFSNYLPAALTENFDYDVHISREPEIEDLILSGFFEFRDVETVLNEDVEGSEVTSFFANLYPESGTIFSVYGEIDRPKSNYWINSAAFVEGENKIDEARREFRDYALPTEKESKPFEKLDKKT